MYSHVKAEHCHRSSWISLGCLIDIRRLAWTAGWLVYITRRGMGWFSSANFGLLFLSEHVG